MRVYVDNIENDLRVIYKNLYYPWDGLPEHLAEHFGNAEKAIGNLLTQYKFSLDEAKSIQDNDCKIMTFHRKNETVIEEEVVIVLIDRFPNGSWKYAKIEALNMSENNAKMILKMISEEIYHHATVTTSWISYRKQNFSLFSFNWMKKIMSNLKMFSFLRV